MLSRMENEGALIANEMNYNKRLSELGMKKRAKNGVTKG